MGKKFVVNNKISHNVKRGPIKNGKKAPKSGHVAKKGKAKQSAPKSVPKKYRTAIDNDVKVVRKVKLDEEAASSFTDGVYRTVVTTKDVKLY